MMKVWQDAGWDIHIRMSEIEILTRHTPPKGIPTTNLNEGDIWIDSSPNDIWVVVKGQWRRMTLTI